MTRWIRWSLAAAVFVAWLGLMFASMTANVNYGVLLAGDKGISPWALGTATGASDVLKAIAPIVGLWFLSKRWWWPATASAMVFAATLTFSIVAAIGFSSYTRATYSDSREHQQIKTADVVDELGALRKKRGWLPENIVPSPVIEAQMEAKRAERQWGWTDGCTKVESASNRRWCDDYRKLGVDLVQSREAEKLDADIKAASAAMRTQRFVRNADPQASAIAAMSGIPIEAVSIGLILLFAVLIEVGSAFGLTLALALARPEHGPLAGAMTPIAPGKADPTWDPRKSSVDPLAEAPLPQAAGAAPAAVPVGRYGKPSSKPSPVLSAPSSALPRAANADEPVGPGRVVRTFSLRPPYQQEREARLRA